MLAGTLIASQSLLTFPIETLIAAQQDRTGRIPDPPTVRVNKTQPTRGVPSEVPILSSVPTTREISETRLVPEPLLPVGTPSDVENVALASVLRALPQQSAAQRLSRVSQHMTAYPTSPWQPSLLLNAGLLLLRDGYQTRAASAFKVAWNLAKHDGSPAAIAVADRAIGMLLTLEARQGHQETLEQLLQDVGSRELTGAATEQLAGAKQALAVMKHAPEEVFRCGPFALAHLMAAQRGTFDLRVTLTRTGPRGISMKGLAELAARQGFPVVPARRQTGAALPVPSVVHFKSDHFATLVRREGNRYLVRDATDQDGDLWYLDSALQEELSGAALVVAGAIPPGWGAMSLTQADEVWGRGDASLPPAPPGPTSPPTPPCDCSGGGSGQGMATYQVHLLEVSLHVFDTPVGYAPAVGPPVQFRLDYNQRESTQPQTFLYSNLGQRWTFDWISYVKDDPANANASVAVFRRGGGEDVFTGFNASTGAFDHNTRERLQLVRTSASPLTYELRRPDGSRDVFSQSDASSIYPRRVFMTASYDAQGNALTFTYDAQLRLAGVTDALGQVTTLTYGLPEDVWKITAVTDPFGRTATMAYDAAGRLARVTDVIQLWSQFSYASDGFITSLSTPYGTSRFTKIDTGPDRRIDMTDPMGGQERVEFQVWGDRANSDPVGTVPTVAGVTFLNNYLLFRNTHYWDRKAMADAPGDRSKAHLYHWLHTRGNSGQAVSILESEKRPLENRVWYLYANQALQSFEGDGRQPTVIARVLDDGTTQAYKAEFNTWGLSTKRIDPLGRETVFEYAANGIDLLTVKQKNGAGYDLLETRTWNSNHEPLTVTDAAGQTTTYTYTTGGQIATVINAKNETTTYAYNASDQLTGVTGPVTGATSTFTYDGYGRLRTTTDADSYTVTFDYDAFNRPTQATYPDGTTEQTQYRFMDVARRKDRMGRWTTFTHDAMRRQTSVRDPLGRVVRKEWCTCGSLDALIDANGNRTSWDRDVQGRVTKETRANGSVTTYVYETTTSRLKKVTDPKLQDTNHTYFADDTLQQTTFTNAAIATPSVSFTYDGVYDRVATMVDGTGTTTYGYHAVTTPPALGATRLASVDGPLTNDTITYAYDELSRGTTRAINGSSNTVAWAFDGLGRITSEANVLGTFTYTYDATTDRVATVTYPNSQTSTYTYFGNSTDRRLQTIHHKYPNTTTLSKFDYTYDVGGNILTWRQQADAAAALWSYGYDTVDQLTSAVKTSTDPTPAILKRYAYVYDLAVNRTVEQIDDVVMGAAYDTMNRLVSQQPSGALRLEGTVSESATVTVGGKPFDVSGANRFNGSIPIVSGTTAFTITAKDASGNTASQAFEVDSAGTGRTLTFDANGNLTADGVRTFEWDARNQLVAVTVGTHRTEFSYDGLQRRVLVVEKENSVVQSDTKVLWCNREICEERTADGTPVTRRSFMQGEQVSGASRYFSTDHLGSVTEVTNGSATVLARYAFDPWGGRTLTTGADITDVGFTGHRWQSSGTGWLTQYRFLDPAIGRWASDDPLGLEDGPNLYAYVANNPLRLRDPDGRSAGQAVLVGGRIGGQLGGAVGGIVGGPVGVPVGAVVGGVVGVGAVVGGLIWMAGRANSDPYVLPRVNPGKTAEGCCKPCPPNGPVWSEPGNKHGATGGKHYHQIVYHQTPDCWCEPKRISGPTPEAMR